MPLDFSIQQGSLILGNDATPSVLIGHFERSTGGINYTDVSQPTRLIVFSLFVSRNPHAITASC